MCFAGFFHRLPERPVFTETVVLSVYPCERKRNDILADRIGNRKRRAADKTYGGSAVCLEYGLTRIGARRAHIEQGTGLRDAVYIHDDGRIKFRAGRNVDGIGSQIGAAAFDRHGSVGNGEIMIAYIGGRQRNGRARGHRKGRVRAEKTVYGASAMMIAATARAITAACAAAVTAVVAAAAVITVVACVTTVAGIAGAAAVAGIA